MCSHTLVSVLVLPALVSAAISYPATYPFENEKYVPAPLPAETPDWSFDIENDPGGYIYYGPETFTFFPEGIPTDDMFPYTPHNNRFSTFLIAAYFNLSPVQNPEFWNCTLTGNFFEAGNFYGEVNGENICVVGSCCTSYIGLPKWSNDQGDNHDWLNSRVKSALCPSPVEDLYCMLVNGQSQIACVEMFPSALERIVTPVCYNVYITYYLSCPLFKTVYTPSYEWDTNTYRNKCSVEEFITYDAHAELQDRVCHPASYYDPSQLKEAGGQPVAGSTQQNDSESSTGWLSVIFACLLLMM